MKKQKLAIQKETIRHLQTDSLTNVVGGSMAYTGANCKVVGSGVCTGQVSIIFSRCGSGPINITPIETLTGG